MHTERDHFCVFVLCVVPPLAGQGQRLAVQSSATITVSLNHSLPSGKMGTVPSSRGHSWPDEVTEHKAQPSTRKLPILPPIPVGPVNARLISSIIEREGGGPLYPSN